MQIRDLLTRLDLGNAVAEFDEALEEYFVETDTFRLLVEGKRDIIAVIRALVKPLSSAFYTRDLAAYLSCTK
jgi:hypothetical protein